MLSPARRATVDAFDHHRVATPSRAQVRSIARERRARGGGRARGTGEWTMKNMYRRVVDRDRVDRS